MELTGKNVLVIGASGVLGQEFVRQLTARGANVLATARTSESATNIPDNAASKLLLDLGSQQSIDTLVNYLNSAVELAGVVVAAGRVAFGPASTMPAQAIQELNQTNYLAPMELLNRLQPNLARQDEAFVLNISGIVASTPMPQMAHYSASKAAIHGFLLGVTREWRRDGIKVASSLLGHTETGLATRPIAGESPKLPEGLNPVVAVTQILEELLD